ncbi:MAG: hypothetical protein AVDCRST_MAG07-1901, partial [uncultured Frankineae bacterium]
MAGVVASYAAVLWRYGGCPGPCRALTGDGCLP